MAGQLLLIIVLLTCITVSWGVTCNLTSHESSRTNVHYEKTMLDGWIYLANNFVHDVAPKDLTVLDKVEEYRQGNGAISFKDLIFDVMRIEAAFTACFMLGLIFFLTMGTGWSCFLCCRCCGNCGGNKTQRQTKNINNRRCIYVVLTIAVLGFLVAAVASAFMANEELYKVTTRGHGSIVKVIDKVEQYVNDTHKEITTLIDCVADEKESLIENAGDENINENIAEPLKDDIQSESAGIITILKKLNTEFQDVKGLKEKVAFVKRKEERVRQLASKIQALKDTCPPTSSDVECTNIRSLDPSRFKEETSNSFSLIPPKVNPVLDFDFNREFQAQLNQTPRKIVRETKKSREDIVKDINSLMKNDNLKEGIDKAINDFYDGANSFEVDVSDYYKKYVTDQEVNRYWGFFGVIMLVAVPSGLLFLGLCFGLLGSKSGRYPSERSGLSDCGGCTLMASVYLMFVFGSLAMLCTAVLFQVGGHAEAYGCRYLYEKNLTTVDHVLQIFLPNSNDSKVVVDLKTLKIGGIASQCENDAAIYQAVPNLESILRVKYLTFDKEIEKVNFDKYEKEISRRVTAALDRLEHDINTAITAIDINALHELLRLAKGKIIEADITATIKDLEPLDASSNDERSKLLKDVLGILRELKEAKEKRNEITTTLGTYGAEIAKYKSKVDSAMADVQAEVDEITPRIGATAEQKVKDYCNDIIHQLKEFVKEHTKIIQEDMGKCGNLYDAFSLGRHFACREVLGPINALWFSLGMCCFFFLFAIPFATKLSKHFYVMDEDEASYVGMDSLHGHPINGYAEHQGPAPHYKNNVAKGNNGYEDHRVRENPHNSRPTHHQNGAYEPDVDERWTRY